jgi:F-type H+-transporting ATPase subunit b
MPTVASHIASSAVLASSEGSFLIKPGIGLMIWTLVVFFLTFLLLKRFAFPAISNALDKRQKAIEDSIDTAERTRQEADRILAEYRDRLKEARSQADEIVQRARQTADSHTAESKQQGQELIAEAQQRAEREIKAATERALSELRREVADLTVTATEKVTRKALSEADQRRLVDEALAEMDFSELSAGSPS